MRKIEWKESYSVGVPLFDEQHKYLVDLLNDLIDSNNRKVERKELFAICNKIIGYAEEHFKNEESIMLKCRYPKLKEHQEEHARLIEDVFVMYRDFCTGGQTSMVEIVDFLKDWILDHILGFDMEYKSFLTQTSA